MKRQIIQIVLIGMAAVILSLLYFLYPATSGSGHPRCLFHALTGLNCPGCGSQRAASALLHGDWKQALHDNVLFVTSIPFVLYSAFVFTWNTFSKNKMQQSIFYSPFFVKTVLLVVVLFAVLRNIPARPFNFLAP